jgi:hypothetical protein
MASLSCTLFEEETCVLVVKNTFITLQMDCPNKSRRMSIPSSLRLFLESPTEGEVDCQQGKPRGYSDASTAVSDEDVVVTAAAPDSIVGSYVSWHVNSDNDLDIARLPSKDNYASATPSTRSNVQARVLDRSQRYKYDFAKVIKRSMRIMQESELVAHVKRSDDSQGCSLILQMSDQGCSQKERVLALAQKALLDAAVPSKSIYIMGYCSANGFMASESGFEATFVGMENAATACWHIFKRGFCRHGSACRKQHPFWRMQTRVLVAGAPRAAPEAVGMNEMKVES